MLRHTQSGADMQQQVIEYVASPVKAEQVVPIKNYPKLLLSYFLQKPHKRGIFKVYVLNSFGK